VIRRFVVSSLVVLATALSPAFGETTDELTKSLLVIEKLQRAGDLEEASKQAGELVQKNGKDLRVHVAWQDLQLALGKDKELLETYRPPAKEETATADAHYLLARLLRGTPAVNEYRAALKIDPQHFAAMCGLGNELITTRGFGEAKTVLEAAAALQPKAAAPLNTLGRVEEARNKTEEAEKRYRAAIELEPNLTIARVNLALLLANGGKRDQAMQILKDAIAAAPRDPMPLLAQGMVFANAKDDKSALDSFQKALAVETGNVTTLNLLANAYVDLGQSDLAEGALKQALKKAPTSVTTKVSLAALRIKAQKFDEAVVLAGEAVAADDSSPEAHYVLAVAYDHQIELKKADAEYRKALKLDDDNPLYLRACAAFDAAIGEWSRSISEYQKVCKMVGNTTQSQLELANAYIGATKFTNAASTLDQIVAADPACLDAWLDLGIVCMRDLKSFKRAQRAFKEYQARGGKDVRVGGWLAQIDAMK
jgi:tetratricopeptide (TPR) repeat protein